MLTFAASNDTTVSEGTTVYTYNYTLSDPGHDVIASIATGCSGEPPAADDNTYQATAAVNNVPPTHVDGGGPYYGLVGQPVLLHGAAACAPGDTCTYAWDLDNDGAFATDANGKTKVHLTSQQTTVKRYTLFLPIVIR